MMLQIAPIHDMQQSVLCYT